MQIAVCDDERAFRQELTRRLTEYKNERNITMDICEFEDGQSLLSSGRDFDMIFLDCELPKKNGLEIAAELRRRSYLCGIIFITAYPQYVYDSFEVQPFRFFLKPLDEQKLIAAMDSFLAHQGFLNPVVVMQDGTQIALDARKIIYLEGDGKYCLIRTADGFYRSSKTLGQVQELLPAHCFYRIHKSYVVNMYCIAKVDEHEVLMVNGERAAVGRSRTKEFRRIYREFVRNYYVRR